MRTGRAPTRTTGRIACTLAMLAGCGHGIRAGVDPGSADTGPSTIDSAATDTTPTIVDSTAPTSTTPTAPTATPTAATGDTGSTGDTAAPAPWSHTATIDGDPGEFGPDEAWPTPSGTVHLTWDATTLYVAATHPDVEAGGAEHWLMVYLGDGSRGTTEGVAMGSQQPSIATPVSHVVRRKADGSYDDLSAFTGADWVPTAGWLSSGPGQVAEAGTTVELAIPLAGIATDQLVVHVSWVYEGVGYESSYAPVPTSSFVDGYDPDYGAWLGFDLTSPVPPASQ